MIVATKAEFLLPPCVDGNRAISFRFFLFGCLSVCLWHVLLENVRAYAKEWMSVLTAERSNVAYYGVAELSNVPSFLRRPAMEWIKRTYDTAKTDGPVLLLDAIGHFRKSFNSKPNSVLIIVIDQARNIRHLGAAKSPDDCQLQHIRDIVNSCQSRPTAKTLFRLLNPQPPILLDPRSFLKFWNTPPFQ